MSSLFTRIPSGTWALSTAIALLVAMPYWWARPEDEAVVADPGDLSPAATSIRRLAAADQTIGSRLFGEAAPVVSDEAAASAQAAAAPPPPPPVQPQLLGTAIRRGGRAVALLKSPQGSAALYGVGQSVAGWRVVAIGDGSVEIRGHSERHRLTVAARTSGP